MSVPPDILAALQGQAGPQNSPDPLQALQECIQTLPGVIAALPSPQDTQDATQALLILTRIQTRLMGNGGQPGPGAGG